MNQTKKPEVRFGLKAEAGDRPKRRRLSKADMLRGYYVLSLVRREQLLHMAPTFAVGYSLS
jgi:hypothetical protein